MISVLFVGALAASFEIQNDERYKAFSYNVYLNDEFVKISNKNVFSIYDLKPNTHYRIKIKSNHIIYETEFTTLNHKIIKFVSNEKNSTKDLQNAINNLSNDEVLVIDKEYKITSVFLKSNTNIYLSSEAKLIGDNDRLNFPILKANEYLNGIPLGTWEGKAEDSFASIITGLGVQNVVIYGKGIIDCDAQNGDWWINHRELRIARRPKGIFLHTCNYITIQGIKVCNTPSWNQHPFYSNHLKYINVSLINPPNSPTTDGIDPESCDDVLIVGTKISVGDDCIAIKSGKIDFARKYHTPCSNITIRNCKMERGHGAVTLGSENSGGINNLEVHKCLFTSTDRGLRIKTQRSRGNLSVLENIKFDNIDMEDVKAPFVINAFYKAGNDIVDYRFDRNYHDKNDETPELKKFLFENIFCNDVSYGLGFFLGLPESKIEEITLRNVFVRYKRDSNPGVMAMTLEKEEFHRIGIYAENIKNIVLDSVYFDNKPSKDIIRKNVDEVKIC